jgi:hypothetical protein
MSIRVEVPPGMSLHDAEKNAAGLLKTISLFTKEIRGVPVMLYSSDGENIGVPVIIR